MLVVDTSVVAAWLLPDENSASAAKAMVHLAGEPGIVPPLFRYEIANAILSARRRGMTEAVAARMMDRLDRLRLEVRDDGQAPARLSEVAALHDLSVFDAAYLARRSDAAGRGPRARG